MILNQIVAIDQNLGIGKDNKLLWHFTEDLKFFKKTTTGKVLIMGRKTLESILSLSGKPLPNRFHIVLSRKPQNLPQHEGVVYVSTLQQAYDKALDLIERKLYPEDVYVIGGAEIYKETLKDCHKLYITQVAGIYHADAFYPSNYNQLFQLQSRQGSETQPALMFEIWTKI